ncbi:MAG: ABC transporter ATP-binding protein [Brevibacterium aurantiacum]|uniref:ABC transporter ATP-binding protein n=1 Tax=Brevibacterium aurantiacum TaxID=273384 RepID=A0A1D7W6P5_BREAU|nr:ABC transporter ATP-binding protein [Brevibacterium aurantiacum]MDN5550610.1 ABC transporter ATP-binding protein/permease [Brevibacterium sp.]AOP54671.1 Lipid A export ATP-binding/permease protein MsbA [Brevibacterium aurantiacum]AZL06590.1 ABC transporter ATP-binding protein [Brevibacterium aurantiacum]AZL10175.1 ABC transporter ATP-binding protein [Brevibacterium aurantiacum]AZT94390.1 ABC transporter ATP-binding protein [Brevibacterium aurantiacum]
MSLQSAHRVMWSSVSSKKTPKTSIKPGTYRRIGSFATRHKAKLIVFLTLSVGTAVIGVLNPVLAGDVVNAITGGGPVATVVWLAVAIGGLAIADAAISIFNRYLSSQIGEGLIFDLRTAVYDHVQRMPIAFFNRTRTGALVSRLNTDVIGAQRAFSNTLSGIVSNFVSLVLTVGVMVTISWQVTLLSILLLPLFIIPTRLLSGKLASLQFQAAENSADMSTRMTERFSAGGATLVKLFGNPKTESEEFSDRAGQVRDIGIKVAMLQSTFVSSLTLVSALALALVYGIGGAQAVLGHLNAGQVVTLALLLTRLYTPLTMLANARLDIMSAVVSFQRVFEILDLVPLIKEPESPKALPKGGLDVTFSDVDFAYPSADQVSLASLEDVSVLDARGGDEVLHSLDFTIPAGHTVALVGSSGAGKSTIASLLPRLYDVTSGSITIGGVDVRELSYESLRKSVGVVTQDGHVFHESIRSNLALVKPEATEAELHQAIDRAQLHNVIATLPDGLDTVIGERGYRLSGGERQRLTIARMLLAAPEVVVLDEATSALDSTNEAAVQQALAQAMHGRTALVIAHRLSTIRQADTILVVEAGRIVESGSHEELLASSGRYAQLYETQFATN